MEPLRVPPSNRAGAWRWPLGLLILVLTAVGGWAIGRSAGPAVPGADSPEVRFARDMAAHHDQAVSMALILYARGGDEDLRTIALDTILTQQAQIGQMQGWLAAWRQPLTGAEPPMAAAAHAGGHQSTGMARQSDINALTTLPVGEAERLFLQLMIPHHQGGVAMAQAVLAETEQPEVVRLANAIISSQQSEIEAMQALLDRMAK